MTGWISIQDALPNDGEKVLIAWEWDGALIWDAAECSIRHDGSAAFSVPYVGQELDTAYYNVTHWMIPKLPEE